MVNQHQINVQTDNLQKAEASITELTASGNTLTGRINNGLGSLNSAYYDPNASPKLTEAVQNCTTAVNQVMRFAVEAQQKLTGSRQAYQTGIGEAAQQANQAVNVSADGYAELG